MRATRAPRRRAAARARERRAPPSPPRPRSPAARATPRAERSPECASPRSTSRPASSARPRAARAASSCCPACRSGAYEVRAALAGFRPLAQSGITVVLGEPAVLTLTLEVGATDEVTVSGDASVGADARRPAQLPGERGAVSDLPLNGRNYTDLAFLQPGVLSFPHRDGGSIVAHGLAASINGQDPRSNVYLLDGTLLNDFTNGPAGSAASTSLGTETVREFRVETNAYSAEFGRNSGGQINVITKSGQNDWHGSLYEYHRNDALDARNFFDPDREARLPPQPVRRDARRARCGRTRASSSVGYEGLRERLGKTISTVVPDEAARLGILPRRGGGTITRAREPRGAAVPRRVPAPERREPRRRPRRVHVPVRPDDRPGPLPGAARPEPRALGPAVRPLHLRPRRRRRCRPTSRSSRAPSSRPTSS